MTITIICEEPKETTGTAAMINQMLEPFDESEVDIQVYYIGQSKNLLLDAFDSDLTIFDQQSLSTILQSKKLRIGCAPQVVLSKDLPKIFC